MISENRQKFDWEGKTYAVGEIGIEEVFVKTEDYLRTQRRPPIDAILKEYESLSKHPELQSKLVDKAYEDLRDISQPIAREKVMKWIDTFDGYSFLLWLGVSKNHPEVTYEQAKKMLLGIGANEVKKMREELMKSEVERIKSSVGEEAWKEAENKADELSTKSE